jgi:hypothetical protein
MDKEIRFILHQTERVTHSPHPPLPRLRNPCQGKDQQGKKDQNRHPFFHNPFSFLFDDTKFDRTDLI